MTSTRAPIDLHAETELQRRIHAESPYWDMMYSAMLSQLTDYIELTVTRALEAHGLAPGQAFGRPTGAAPARVPSPPSRPAETRESRYDQPMAARPVRRAREVEQTPLWLQPFTLPEKVRFTRTPDSLLRVERPSSEEPEASAADEPAFALPADLPAPFDPDLPAWRRPFTLPPNVRINRSPSPKPAAAPLEDPAESLAHGEAVAPSSEAGGAPAPAGAGMPSWFAVIRADADQAVSVADQDNASGMPEALESQDGAISDDMIAAAWQMSHEDDWTPVAAASGLLPMQDTVSALLEQAGDDSGDDVGPAQAAPIAPEALPEITTPEPEASVLAAHQQPAKPPVKPLGIASAEDARAFNGPNRATSVRRVAHGPAPIEPAHVAVAPAIWEEPPLELLVPPPAPTGEVLSSGALEQNARLLEGVLEEFGVRGEIIDVRPGPVVTLYELEPAPGTKSSRVIGLSDDIARSMSAVSARVAVVQGRNVIGIELPNQRRETVFLRELLASELFGGAKHKLSIALGKTIGGEPIIVDLSRMPHLLVAGTTGSGKSVAINTMILSLLYRLKPEECRLIMIDPKMLELSVYEGIPHLLTPVVTDPKKAVVALKWAVREMEDRYKKMSKVGVRNIDGFNVRVAEAAAKGETITRTVQTGYNRETGEAIFESEEMALSPLPYIVVIVDEMADLMMVAGKDIEGAIQRLAQMARAAGIHLIMATQRPSVDVITGTIKANFPTRISFQVTSKIDSRTILGEQGAEQLLGQGDMLYMAGGGRISRVHGPFVSDGEVEKVVAHLKTQGHPEYLDVIVAEEDGSEPKNEAPDDKAPVERGAYAEEDNDLYEQAVKVVLRDKKCSTSYIQRRLQVGYNKAASLVERMEKEGLVGQGNNAGKREILVYSRDLRFTESREGDE